MRFERTLMSGATLVVESSGDTVHPVRLGITSLATGVAALALTKEDACALEVALGWAVHEAGSLDGNATTARIAQEITTSIPIDSQMRALAVSRALAPIHEHYEQALKMRSSLAPGLARELAVAYGRLAAYFDGGAQ